MVDVLGDVRMYEFTGGRPLTLEELRSRYRQLAVGHSADDSELWFNWIVRTTDGGEPVGVMQATVAADGSWADVAWEIGVPWQGRGIASEAAIAIVDWLIGSDIPVVRAFVHPDHGASAGVAAAPDWNRRARSSTGRSCGDGCHIATSLQVGGNAPTIEGSVHAAAKAAMR